MAKARKTKKNAVKMPALSGWETGLGWVYMVAYLAVWPGLLNRLLGAFGPFVVNLAYFSLNFLAILVIFRHFLADSLAPIATVRWRFLLYVVAGFFGIMVLDALLSALIQALVPGFSNLNDQAVSSLYANHRLVMGLCMGLLVPPVEECLFRGLVFRGLHDTNRLGAYCLSILAFGALHVLNYMGMYPGQMLLLCFLQYIPAGFFLAWSFERTGSIFAPILIHAAVNVVGILTTR